MEEPAIDDVSLEQLISEAIKGDEEALRLLMFSTWLNQLLDRVSGRAARVYKVDAEELRDFVFEKLHLNIRKITKRNNVPWPDCLKSWCYTVAKNHAANIIRHRNVEERYQATVSHENTQNIRHGKRMTAHYSSAVSQEDEAEQKEREAAQSTLLRAVREALDSPKPERDSLTSQLADNEGGPLFNAMLRKADEFFNAAQQERLTELMRLRRERILSSEEGQELESLIEAELDGARLRAEAEIRWRLKKEITSILSGFTEREWTIIGLWFDGLSEMEIADKSNVSPPTVYRTLKKMMKRVQKSLYNTHKEKPQYRRGSLSEAEEKSA